MSLMPFALVEMEGMSIVTATWFMFITTGICVGGGVLIHWVLREFSGVWKRLDEHSDDIKETNQNVAMLSENVAVTRMLVERIDKKLNEED